MARRRKSIPGIESGAVPGDEHDLSLVEKIQDAGRDKPARPRPGDLVGSLKSLVVENVWDVTRERPEGREDPVDLLKSFVGVQPERSGMPFGDVERGSATLSDVDYSIMHGRRSPEQQVSDERARSVLQKFVGISNRDQRDSQMDQEFLILMDPGRANPGSRDLEVNDLLRARVLGIQLDVYNGQVDSSYDRLAHVVDLTETASRHGVEVGRPLLQDLAVAGDFTTDRVTSNDRTVEGMSEIVDRIPERPAFGRPIVQGRSERMAELVAEISAKAQRNREATGPEHGVER